MAYKVYKDGSEYVGSLVDGKRTGHGTLRYQSGARYEGDWFDDKFHGDGTYDYQDGSRYCGTWLNGMRHGEGEIAYSDGSSFVGMWSLDKRNGHGEVILLYSMQTFVKTPMLNLIKENTYSKMEIPMKAIIKMGRGLYN